MTDARLIEIAQYRIAEALAKLECELQCVVDSIWIEKVETATFPMQCPVYDRRVRLELRMVGGWESAASSGSSPPSGTDVAVAAAGAWAQVAAATAEVNDNYRHSRRLVGEALLSLVKEDINQREK